MDTRRPRLRTKTGCLTSPGRQRRKKCDEKYPVCDGCGSSQRSCQWPSRSDLMDRRFVAHEKSRYLDPSSSRTKGRRGSDGHVGADRSPLALMISQRRAMYMDGATPAQRNFDVILAQQIAQIQAGVLVPEAGVAHSTMSHGLEHVISRHFAHRFYGLLVLPDCHPGFYDCWLGEILNLMSLNKSLYYSVLACAASHIHFIDTKPQMQELALGYYSNSISSLSRQLDRAAAQLENHNGVLISVMLLYLHGCMGQGTYTDIPRHVVAATRILTMRLFNRSEPITRLFDKLAVESVLYQIFLSATGLWSDGIRLDYELDINFWLQAERLLSQSTFFPDSSTLDTPVLGVPAQLFRLAMTLREHFRHPEALDEMAIESLRNEVETWEVMMICDERNHADGSSTATLSRRDMLNRDSTRLYALISSIVFEKLVCGETDIIRPVKGGTDGWQMKKALAIMKEHLDDFNWFECYIGIWPVYTLGCLVESHEGMNTIIVDLQRRWDQTKLSLVARYMHDLDMARGLGDEPVMSGKPLSDRYESMVASGRLNVWP